MFYHKLRTILFHNKSQTILEQITHQENFPRFGLEVTQSFFTASAVGEERLVVHQSTVHSFCMSLTPTHTLFRHVSQGMQCPENNVVAVARCTLLMFDEHYCTILKQWIQLLLRANTVNLIHKINLIWTISNTIGVNNKKCGANNERVQYLSAIPYGR